MVTEGIELSEQLVFSSFVFNFLKHKIFFYHFAAIPKQCE